MQKSQTCVSSGCDGIVVYWIHYIHGILHPLLTASTDLTFFGPKTIAPRQYTAIPLNPLPLTKDNVLTTIYHNFTVSIVSTVSTAYCIVSTAYCIHCFVHPQIWPFGLKTMPHHHIPLFHCIHWFDFFAPKTMSAPSSTNIPLHPLVSHFYTKNIVPTTIYHYSSASTVSTGLTFLHQRQCPYHKTPVLYCIHCILCPLCPLHSLHPLHTASTAYWVHNTHWFDFFAPKIMSWPPYTTMLLHPLCPMVWSTVSAVSTAWDLEPRSTVSTAYIACPTCPM